MRKTQWTVDPAHSNVQFKIKHLVISSVTGSFRNFHGGAASDAENFEDAEIHFSVDVSSIDTNVEARDAHLRSADFFDAGVYPTITFQSNYFHKVKGDRYNLSGLLTLKGITQPVEFVAEYGGAARDATGNLRIGFEVSGSISRWEFGLNYGILTESGKFLLGEDVQFTANIQLVQEATMTA